MSETSCPENMNDRSNLLNFLKGISIFGVALYHLITFFLDVPEIIKTASSFGGAGVHIFIICSGFGLALSYNRKAISWTGFMKKRFFVIYIPYIIVVLVSSLFPYTYEGNDRMQALLSHVFLYKMFIPKYESSFGGQLWYISTIIQFYFIFILLMKLKNKIKNKCFLIISCCLSLLWMIFTACTGLYEERIWGSFFLQYLWEFSIGICLADYYVKHGTIAKKIGVWKVIVITIISFVIYAFMSLKGGIYKNFNDLFSVLSFGGICLILYRIEIVKRVFLWLSKISYELYLVHIFAFLTFYLLFGKYMSNWLTGFFAFVFSILLALMFNFIIRLIKKK